MRWAPALALAALAACDPDAAPPCEQPFARGETCDVALACCRERIATAVEALLGGRPIGELEYEVATLEAFRQDDAEARWARSELHDAAWSDALRWLGFVRAALPSVDDAVGEARRFAGRYRSGQRRVQLVIPPRAEDRAPAPEMDTLAHELAHAWQDANVSLEAFYAGVEGADARAARAMVVEGHADFVQALFRADVEGLPLDRLDWTRWARDVRAHYFEGVDAAEVPWLTERMSAPYVFGLAVMANRFVDFGHDVAALDFLFAEPPGSLAAAMGLATGTFPGDARPIPVWTPREETLAHVGLLWLGERDLTAWDAALRVAAELGAAPAFDLAQASRGAGVRLFVTLAADPLALFASTWSLEAHARAFADTVAATPPLAGDPAPLVRARGRHVIVVAGHDDDAVAGLAEAFDGADLR